MSNRPPPWIDPLMRAGFAARGVVYLLIGILAVIAAVTGGRAPDSHDALGAILSQPFGRVMLAVIALGLVAYSAWRFVDAVLDLDDKGTEVKGWLARSAQFGSGLAYISIALSAAVSSWSGRRDNEDGTVGWTATLMAEPWGRWLVGAFGLIVLGFGVQHLLTAIHEKYKESMRYTPTAAKLDGVVKFGLVAHGVVICIVGSFFIWAAWNADPSRVGGVAEALTVVRSMLFGKVLLILMGMGLLSFSAYCFVQSAYRVVPRCKAPDLRTLATMASELQQDAERVIKNLAR